VRYVIFSDIHSNLEALEAVLEHSVDKGADELVCLGDFVGYAADPEACVQRVKSRGDVQAVLGNHDAAAIDPLGRGLFNQFARAGILYSEQQLSDSSREFLGALPLTSDLGSSAMVVHASPHNPGTWTYVLEPMEAEDAFDTMSRAVAFIGHTHYPAIHTSDGVMRTFLPGQAIALDDGGKTLINVGSVGQPRDGDSRSAYVVYDVDANTVEMHRVEYDIDGAAQKILAAGLPQMLADRLQHGY